MVKLFLKHYSTGGHTTELIRLLYDLPSGFTPRHYVVANSDHMSESKVKDLEAVKSSDKECVIFRVPR